MPYAERTTVSPEKSRLEIEQTLSRYGATAFSYGWEGDHAVVVFRASARAVKFVVDIPSLDQFLKDGRGGVRSPKQRADARDQAVRQRWRALALVVKAKLEAVETGITTFEEEFMAHILLPDGQTFGAWAAPQLHEVYESGQMPSLLPAPSRALPPGGEE